MNNTLSYILNKNTLHEDFKLIAKKIICEERITVKDGIRLFDAELSYLGALANYIREKNTRTIPISIEIYT